MKKTRIAILGTSHPHAYGFYKAFSAEAERIEWVGYADIPCDSQEPKQKALSNLGQEAVTVLPCFNSAEELLAQKPELVLISTDNAACREAACMCLSRGMAAVVEKPMAISFDDAQAMLRCAKECRQMLAVNWPIAWFPAFNLAKEWLDAGKIGRLMRVTYRSPATWGPYSYSKDGELPPADFLHSTWWYRHENGGGSLLDYACYGAALSTWFFGHTAERVSGLTKNFALPGFDVEDYSAMMLDFGEGVGLLEGSWSTYNPGQIPSGPVLYGTEGVIVCDRHSQEVKLYRGRSHGAVDPTECVNAKDHYPGLALGKNVLDHLTAGSPLHPLLEAERNVQIMAALEAGRQSSHSGMAEATRKIAE